MIPLELTPTIGTMRRTVGGYLALTKPRIVELLLVTTLPTMILAAGHLPTLKLAAATLVGGALAAGGANAANMYFDRDIDRLMARTRRRPLVTGTVTPGGAIIFAAALEIVAFGVLLAWVNPLSAFLTLLAASYYVGFYTVLLKRRTTHNITIGGVAGAIPVLVAWTAVTGHVGLPAFLLFLAVVLWTPPHFWALAVRCADDYRIANVPMLPSVAPQRRTSTAMLLYGTTLAIDTFAFASVINASAFLWGSVIVLALSFMARLVQFHRLPSHETASRVFHYSITYLTLLFTAVAVEGLLP